MDFTRRSLFAAIAALPVAARLAAKHSGPPVPTVRFETFEEYAAYMTYERYLKNLAAFSPAVTPLPREALPALLANAWPNIQQLTAAERHRAASRANARLLADAHAGVLSRHSRTAAACVGVAEVAKRFFRSGKLPVTSGKA
jgi:hypothetical protein